MASRSSRSQSTSRGPVAYQRLVGHLDLVVGGQLAGGQAHQARADQLFEHPVDAIVRLAGPVQHLAPDAVAGDFKPIAQPDHPQQDALGGDLLLGDQPIVEDVGAVGERQATAAQPAVGVPGDPVALAVLPQLEQGELQKRQRGRLTKDILEQRVDHAVLELQPDQLGRLLDRLAQLGGVERRHLQPALLEDRMEGRQARDKRLEVAAHGQDDDMLRVRRGD